MALVRFTASITIIDFRLISLLNRHQDRHHNNPSNSISRPQTCSAGELLGINQPSC